jgi:hypothetical protein
MVLAFKFKMGVLGFWTGLLVTTSGQALLQLVVIARFDWDLEAERARTLVGSGAPGDLRGDLEIGGDLEGEDEEEEGGLRGGAPVRGKGAPAGGAPTGPPAAGRDQERRPLLLDTSRTLSAALSLEHGSFAGRRPSGRLEAALGLVLGGGRGSFSGGDPDRASSSLELPRLQPGDLPGSGLDQALSEGKHREPKAPAAPAGSSGADAGAARDQWEGVGHPEGPLLPAAAAAALAGPPLFSLDEVQELHARGPQPHAAPRSAAAAGEARHQRDSLL